MVIVRVCDYTRQTTPICPNGLYDSKEALSVKHSALGPYLDAISGRS